jgi:hypothetical protein
MVVTVVKIESRSFSSAEIQHFRGCLYGPYQLTSAIMSSFNVTVAESEISLYFSSQVVFDNTKDT